MNTEKPTTYRIQPGCHDCEHCHTHRPYDDPFYFYCTNDQTEPPRKPDGYDDGDALTGPLRGKAANPSWIYRKLLDDWRHALPEIHPGGICDFYETREIRK